MHKIVRRYNLVLLLPLVIVLFGCSIPFDVTSEEAVIDLPVTGDIQEVSVNVPGDARKSGVSIDEVTLEYTAVNLGTTSTTAKIYIALNPPPTTESDRKIVLQLTLAGSETKQGETSPDILREAIKQDRFTIGLQRTGASTSLRLTIRLKIKGSVPMIVI